MDIKLFDSELKVMCVLWNEGDTTAKHISDVLKKEIGWNMNTTYTLIKRCIKKGAIERSEPNFMCHALIPKEEVQEAETKELVATVYKGNIIKNLIMDCQSYTKYRPNETTGGIFVSWRRKEELPTGA